MSEHSQETKIAILEEKVDHMMGHVKELTLRVRANEKVVASVSLLGVIACTFVGAGYFAPKAESAPNPGQWVQEVREWQSEQDRIPIEDMLNSSLADLENGCNDPSKQEILLQFQSHEDQKSLRWRYDRCGDRSRIRSSEDGESEDCWSRHTREENEGFGGKGTWIRCDQLDEGKVKRDDQGR